MDQAQSNDEAQRYPHGRFRYDSQPGAAERQKYIDVLAEFPSRLGELVGTLSDREMETPYRDSGWTARQVVHHLADSHLNGYLRWKLALTENSPTIKPYDEGKWAMLPDVENTPPVISIQLLAAVHARWVSLISGLPESALDRTYIYPEKPSEPVSLHRSLALYAWHSTHHLAHIASIPRARSALRGGSRQSTRSV